MLRGRGGGRGFEIGIGGDEISFFVLDGMK